VQAIIKAQFAMLGFIGHCKLNDYGCIQWLANVMIFVWSSLYIANYHVYGWGLGNNLQSTTLNAIDISRGPYFMSG
jgi:hypothetical protein